MVNRANALHISTEMEPAWLTTRAIMLSEIPRSHIEVTLCESARARAMTDSSTSLEQRTEVAMGIFAREVTTAGE
jgi:hypothetical protein